mgnify:CR=1 FL=1
MDKDIMVKVDNLGICFNLAKERVDSLKEYFLKFTKGSLHFEEFWALKDVSFKIEKGEYPQKLSELVPRYLPKKYVSPYTGKKLNYILKDGFFTLASDDRTITSKR